MPGRAGVTFSVATKGTGGRRSDALVSHWHEMEVSKPVAGGKKGTWTVAATKGSSNLTSSAGANGWAAFTVTLGSTTSSATSSGSGSGGDGY